MATKQSKGSGLEWFIKRGSAVRGPFSSTKVRHYVNEGKLTVDDKVSRDRENWLPLGQVDEVLPLQMRGGEGALNDARDSQRRRDRRRAIRAIVVSIALLSVLTAGVLMVGSDGEEVIRDCSQSPAPGVVLDGCSLARVAWQGANLGQARLANARLAQAKLSTAILGGADMRYADLDGADLSYADLVGATLLGATLRGADLTNADLSGADLRYADLGGALLGGASFTSAKLEGALWIDGSHCAADDCPR